MPRKPTILQNEFPYSVYARCINKEWFTLPMDFVWRIMAEQLAEVHQGLDARIHSFVLMSNHYHLLLSTPKSNIDHIMQVFNSQTSHRLTAAGNRINGTYGGRYKKTIIRHDHHFRCAYKYIYRNPVAAGAVKQVEDYKYSTLRGVLGLDRSVIPVVKDDILFPNSPNTLRWLNDRPTETHWHDVKRAMSRDFFRFRADRNTKKKHLLETSPF